MTAPNVPVVFIPTDPLTLAHQRMREAEMAQLREAVATYQRGEDVGCYTEAVVRYLRFAVAA